MKEYFLLALPFLFFACPAGNESSDAPILPKASQQMLLVVTADDVATDGQLRRFERDGAGEWKPAGAAHPVTVGRSGLAWGKGISPNPAGTVKKEGDGKAPAGVFRLTKIFGYEPPLDISFKMPFVQSNEVLECVDDSHSKYYNQLVDSLRVEKDWTSSEFMRRQDHLYRWGVVVEHNAEAVPQGGSCIFLHIWKQPGVATSGCTAMSEENLLEIIHWLDAKKEPIMVQLTQKDFDKWKAGAGMKGLGL